jgi:SulP family sulfate permease
MSSIIALPQDLPSAILAIIGATVVASLSQDDPEHIFGTVVAAMMLASLLTGAAFWLMGRFNLGQHMRFIPYPVIGGFLGGTGWLLILGGLSVMTSASLGADLFQSGELLKWVPGFLYGAALFAVLRRYTHFLISPSFLLGGILLFYVGFLIVNGSLTSANLDEWLLGPFPSGSLFRFMTLRVFTEGHITVLFGNILDFSSIIIVSAIALLLNASGLELVSGEDGDLNQELKSAGIANLVAGLGGSPPGYHSLSLSALGSKLGSNNRMVGIFSFIIILFVMIFGAAILSAIPKMVAGGMLIFLGISFLFEWIYDAWFTLPKLDYFLIWLILIIIATVGFLEGVAVGILVAALLFVLNYSRINVVRHGISGANFASHVIRPRLHQQLVKEKGDGLYILELQGYIFFGTADKLVSGIRERISDPDLPKIRYLILDFRLVTGIDSSATLSFSKLKQLAEAQEITLIFTCLSLKIQSQLEKEVYGEDQIDKMLTFPDLDHGVAWCEDKMIEIFTEVGLVAKPKTIIDLVEESLSHQAEDKDWVDMIAPGTAAKPSKRASRMLKFLERIEAKEGDHLIDENYEIEGLYFIEEGQISAQLPCGDDPNIELRLLESGTVFGEIDYYAEQSATLCYIASRPSTLYFLSTENLKRMEEEDHELAIAFHRILAGLISKKLSLTDDTVQALRD